MPSQILQRAEQRVTDDLSMFHESSDLLVCLREVAVTHNKERSLVYFWHKVTFPLFIWPKNNKCFRETVQK